MKRCEKCGKLFDSEEAEFEFDSRVDASFTVSYYQFNIYLCADCAIEEYENGNYFETCECCGKSFNPEEDKHEFERLVSHKIMFADMYEFGIHCADCAAEKVLEKLDNE